MARNIEIKAAVADLAPIRRRVRELTNAVPQTLEQVDTFFAVQGGRLKLREFASGRGELIWYVRDDAPGPSGSDYLIVPSDCPSLLKTVLAEAIGVKGTVAKRREVHLVGKTRVHLDEVASLGSFVELEYVMDDDEPDAHGEAVVAELLDALGIASGQLISKAYVDLIAERI